MNEKKITVIHSVRSWLPQTQTWLFGQVGDLPSVIESHIVCETTANLDQFWLPNIHSLANGPRWRYLWDKGLRKVGVRHHLSFLVQQARLHRARVLHSHFGNVGWGNTEAARRRGMKHVVTFYGLDLSYLPRKNPHWNERYRELFQQANRVLCEGPHMAQCVVNVGCPENKIRVHHLGVRVDELAYRPRIWNPAQRLRVLIAATFREKKGIPYALEALGQLQHEVPLEITIIGDASGEARSQAEKRRILATIEKHNLLPKTRMLGFEPQSVFLEEAYKHHIFLSPSVTARDGDTEGGAPVAIIEMAATGMPVVSTKHCDIPHVVRHGATGLLAQERDVDGLVRHLKWLVDHPEQWNGMAEAAREHVEEEFNASVQGKRLAAIYRELAN